jgi:hypothetical protein
MISFRIACIIVLFDFGIDISFYMCIFKLSTPMNHKVKLTSFIRILLSSANNWFRLGDVPLSWRRVTSIWLPFELKNHTMVDSWGTLVNPSSYIWFLLQQTILHVVFLISLILEFLQWQARKLTPVVYIILEIVLTWIIFLWPLDKILTTGMNNFH